MVGPVVRRYFHVPPYDLSAQVLEDLVDVLSPPRTRFVIRHVAPALADTKRTHSRDGPVFFQVALVAHEHYWYPLVVLDADDLRAEFFELVEGGQRGYAEDEEKSLAAFDEHFAGATVRLVQAQE